MATILEEGIWTLTEAAAERMVENGLIERCDQKHYAGHLYYGENDEEGLLVIDHPVYHRSPTAPDWFGFATMHQAIISAEKHAEEATNAERTVVPPAPDASE